MTLKYQTGAEIQKGDRISFHGEPGRIEFVAADPGDAETEWYIQEYGGGVMIVDANAGRTFLPADEINGSEDLEFVSRADGI
jgi:hypothetical protein